MGALLVRPGLKLAAQLHGGSQQDGRRAGTLPVPLVVGLGEALLGAEADREERPGGSEPCETSSGQGWKPSAASSSTA